MTIQAPSHTYRIANGKAWKHVAGKDGDMTTGGT